MIDIPYLKAGAVLAALAAVIGLFAYATVQGRRADEFKARTLAYERCERAVLGKPSSRKAQPEHPSEVCRPEVAAVAIEARASADCNAALAAEPDLYRAGQACRQGVRQLLARHQAAQAEAADLRGQLDKADAAAGRAIARTEARVRTEEERKARAAIERASAARDSDGLRRCDDECLRNRAQGWVAAPESR